jgi:hypothetical protein
MAPRLQTNPTIGSGNNPSPDTYDTISAFRKITAKNTHITLKSRAGGTQISTAQTAGNVSFFLFFSFRIYNLLF